MPADSRDMVRTRLDWPTGEFRVHDPDPDDIHSAIYLVCPNGLMVNTSCDPHPTRDAERTRWMADALNAALSASPARGEGDASAGRSRYVTPEEIRDNTRFTSTNPVAPSPGEGDAPVAWRPQAEAPNGCVALVRFPSGEVGVAYKTRNEPPFLQDWRWAIGGERGTQAPWPEEYVPLDAVLASLTRPTPATPAGASFLGHLVETYGGEHQFVPAGQPLPLPPGRGKVTPVYDGPQNVTATPEGLTFNQRLSVERLNLWLADTSQALHPDDVREVLAALQPQAEGEGGMVDLQSVEVRIDPNYPHFGLVGVPQPHRQHTNQQRGLDLYVTVFNLDTGERCFKKLYENRQGLHFKHTGYSPMYLNDFTERAVVYPFQVVRQPEGE